ncbi:cryptochrome/photolyase family protein [Arthrobacter roseus]|uniref:cryptochrome/photolyase family protein n=1 Tax=Arthrobacter roseus TaxID=136274 RepID=UPI0019649C34|nr:deoxyribodipyrimidine photo-lyase [Arthrobacter roseus]MBM7848924.1 deoxyribodipyrimidine photo-lyase [Arthrobacter roseus]
MGTSLVWLRDDLRLADNPALHEAIQHGGTVCVLYVFDQSPDIRPLGAATRWWLHHSLEALRTQIEDVGGQLILRNGIAADVVKDLIAEIGADALLWNRRYGLPERTTDTALKNWAHEHDVEAHSFQANLLFEPWQVQTKQGENYKVFTPFWRACLEQPQPRQPLPAPSSLTPATLRDSATHPSSDALDDWGLLPSTPDWAGGLRDEWTPGEAGAHNRLTTFFDERVEDYSQGREKPGQEATSRLSPHLRFGEISPFQIWQAAKENKTTGLEHEIRVFGSEVGWREFCWQLLYHNPDLATQNYRREYDAFEWEQDTADDVSAWQQGHTGYPMVDAGMRQLWNTGWMHNRIRMVTASFLIKNLMVNWRTGEQWFWDTLVDADAASNPANWQWVAGSGADAAPYFRIFNPVTQSKKFDPSGGYLRRFVPELAALDDSSVHEPWKNPEVAPDYPEPIVDLKETRHRALDAYARVKDH